GDLQPAILVPDTGFVRGRFSRTARRDWTKTVRPPGAKVFDGLPVAVIYDAQPRLAIAPVARGTCRVHRAPPRFGSRHGAARMVSHRSFRLRGTAAADAGPDRGAERRCEIGAATVHPPAEAALCGR